MKIYLVVLLSTIAYATAAWLALKPQKLTSQAASALPIIPATTFGVLCHVYTLFYVRHDIEQFGSMAMLSLMGLVITVVSLFQHVLKPYRLPIGLVTLFTALIVWVPFVVPNHLHMIDNDGSRLHIALAMAAYVSLSFAALYAVLWLIQSQRLKQHVGLSQPETPLTELEKLMMQASLFAMIFLLLSVIISVWFLAAKLSVRHWLKLLFGAAVWLPISIVVVRHYASGFRGQRAATWVLVGAGIAFLGYFITGLMR